MFDNEDDDEPMGNSTSSTMNGLPMPITSPRRSGFGEKKRHHRASVNPDGTPVLLPSRNPPRFSIFDIFPFTTLVKPLTKRGFELGGKTAQRARAKLGLGRGIEGDVVSHNIPLEITLYLVSYSALSGSLAFLTNFTSLPIFLPFNNAKCATYQLSICS